MHEYAHALKRGSHVQFSPAMAEAAKKVVLVCVGEHKREVCFDADGIGENERKKLQEAILEVFRDVLVKDDAESLLLVRSRDIPTPPMLKGLFLQIAQYEFTLKPAAAIAAIHSGVPDQHALFWKNLGVTGLLCLYQAKSISPAKVLKMFDKVQPLDTNQERIMLYLRQYIGSLNTGDLEQFLRFVTGSCVFMPVKIQVSFNSLSGTARRPIAHTCEPSLELSSTYVTYLEFAKELKAVMNVSDNSPAWAMNAL